MIDKDKVLDKYHTSKINMAIKFKNVHIIFTLRQHYGNAMLGQFGYQGPHFDIRNAGSSRYSRGVSQLCPSPTFFMISIISR